LQIRQFTSGAFGGGREGIQRAELQRGTLDVLGRAQQQGFGTALQAAQNQQQLAAQTGLQAGQTLGQLGTTQQTMAQGDIKSINGSWWTTKTTCTTRIRRNKTNSITTTI
jgi:hypothetical protein